MHSPDRSFIRGPALILLFTCVTRASLLFLILDFIFLLPALSSELGQGKGALFSAQQLSHPTLLVGIILSWWYPILFSGESSHAHSQFFCSGGVTPPMAPEVVRDPGLASRASPPCAQWLFMVQYISQSQRPETIRGLLLDTLA